MAQFNVPVTIDGQQMMVPVEAETAEDARAAVEAKYGQPQVESRTGDIIAGGLIEGAADTLDMLLTPITGAVFLGRKATGSLDEDAKFFGDEGFADLSGLVGRASDEVLGKTPLTDFEESLQGFARITGGVASGLGAGGVLRAGGKAALGQLGQKGVQAGASHNIARGVELTGRFLAEQPKLQVTAGIGGEAARQVAEAHDAGIVGQLGAALLGSMSVVGAQAALRRLVVGNAARQKTITAQRSAQEEAIGFIDNDIKSTKENILRLSDYDGDTVDILGEALLAANKAHLKTLKKARKGLKGSVTATPNESVMEVLRRIPGAAGSIEKRATKLATAIRQSLKDEGVEATILSVDDAFVGHKLTSGNLPPEDVAGEAVGRLIVTALKGAAQDSSNTYINLTRSIANAMEASGRPMPSFVPNRTAKTIQSYLATADVGMLPTGLRSLVDDIGTGIKNSADGAVPMERLAYWRRAIGQQLGDTDLNRDIPKDILRRIDDALFADMRAGIANLNKPGSLNPGSLRTFMNGTENAVLDAVERRGLLNIDAADDGAVLNVMRAEDRVDVSTMTVAARNAHFAGLIADGRAFISEGRRILADAQRRAIQAAEATPVEQLVRDFDNARATQAQLLSLNELGTGSLIQAVRDKVGVDPKQVFEMIRVGSKDDALLIKSLRRLVHDFAADGIDVTVSSSGQTIKLSGEEAMSLLQRGFIEHLGKSGSKGPFDLATFLKQWDGINK
jgi:hypothetical protein